MVLESSWTAHAMTVLFSKYAWDTEDYYSQACQVSLPLGIVLSTWFQFAQSYDLALGLLCNHCYGWQIWARCLHQILFKLSRSATETLKNAASGFFLEIFFRLNVGFCVTRLSRPVHCDKCSGWQVFRVTRHQQNTTKCEKKISWNLTWWP